MTEPRRYDLAAEQLIPSTELQGPLTRPLETEEAIAVLREALGLIYGVVLEDERARSAAARAAAKQRRLVARREHLRPA